MRIPGLDLSQLYRRLGAREQPEVELQFASGIVPVAIVADLAQLSSRVDQRQCLGFISRAAIAGQYAACAVIAGRRGFTLNWFNAVATGAVPLATATRFDWWVGAPITTGTVIVNTPIAGTNPNRPTDLIKQTRSDAGALSDANDTAYWGTHLNETRFPDTVYPSVYVPPHRAWIISLVDTAEVGLGMRVAFQVTEAETSDRTPETA